MTEPKYDCFGLVIQTDQYAGNFERELCAYVTGHIGECQVGKDLVDPTIEEMFDGVILQIPDDHGCYRPVSIYDGDGSKYNSLVIFFEERPTKEMIDIIKERAKTFNEAFLAKNGYYSKYPEQWERVNILGYKLVEFIVTRKTISEDV